MTDKFVITKEQMEDLIPMLSAKSILYGKEILQTVESQPLKEEIQKETGWILDQFATLAHQGFSEVERRWILSLVSKLRVDGGG